MAKTSEFGSVPTQDEIAAYAYEIYLREGCPNGKELEHWLRAEAELRRSNIAASEVASSPVQEGSSSRLISAPVPETPAATPRPRGSSQRRATKRELAIAGR